MKKILIDLQCLQTESAHRGIGRYTYNLTVNILQQNTEYDIHILLSSGLPNVVKVRQQFKDYVPDSHFHVFTPVTPCYAIDPNNRQNMEASEFMYEAFVAKINPDLLFITSLFEGVADNSVFSISNYFTIKTIVIGYDLIPFHYEELYLQDPCVKLFLYKRLSTLSNSNCILCISEYITNDIKNYLQYANCINISTGRVEVFEQQEHGVYFAEKFIELDQKKYILYTGGTDFRKNLDGLIKAYTKLSENLKNQYSLVIVGSIPDSEVINLQNKIIKAGVSKNSYIFTYVSDEELVWLYRNTHLFVFPSLDEGFGLPVLEAMQCGAVVCCGDNSSLIEVSGLSEMLFDSKNSESITNKITKLLIDEELRNKIMNHSKEQIKKFSWKSTATKAINSMDVLLSSSTDGDIVLKPKLLVSVVTNMCHNVTMLLRRLSNYFALILIYDDIIPNKWFLGSYKQIPSSELDSMSYNNEYSCIIFDDYRQLGTLSNEMQKLNIQMIINVSENEDFDILNAIALSYYFVKPVPIRLITDDVLYLLCKSAKVQAEQLSLARYVLLNNNILETSSALSQNVNNHQLTTIYVDISSLAKIDHNTGIQRVEKIVLQELFYNYVDFRIVPIYFERERFYVAYKFISKLLSVEIDKSTLPDYALSSFADNSIFIGIDLHFDFLFNDCAVTFLKKQKIKGTKLYNIQYDLIPILPNYSTDVMSKHFHNNMMRCSLFFDGTIAISKAVANEYSNWYLNSHSNLSIDNYNIGYFHLGCDIDNYNSHHASDKIEDLSMLDNKKYMLMVSTLEPRKGHAQVLEAFEKLWLEGSEYCLVLVGKEGWNVDELITKIRSHPQLNKKLIWLQGISDQSLTKVYEMSTAFIMASFAEGFGLGIVESAKYNKPLILRDIPVFREIAEDNAFYFDCLTGDDLAADLNCWIGLHESGKEPKSDKLKTITWKESCDQLMDVILNNKWYKQLNNA